MQRLMMADLHLRVRERRGEDVTILRAAIKRAEKTTLMRERMLYWKRERLMQIRARRRPTIKAHINRAPFVREFFRLKEENYQRWLEVQAQYSDEL